MAENTEVKPKAPRKPKAPKPLEIPTLEQPKAFDVETFKPKAPKQEFVEAPKEITEIEPVVPEIQSIEVATIAENSPEEVKEIPEEAENSPEQVGDLAEQPAAEPEEQEILSGPAELAKVNPNLPDDKSKWLARLVAERGYHILFKGSFAKAYRVADNYNVSHGFPAGKIRRIYK